jgi:hypothetical protein
MLVARGRIVVFQYDCLSLHADRESTGLGLMDRQRVKTWLRAAYHEINAVGI